MKYEDLSVYRGARVACDACGKLFVSGEVICHGRDGSSERIFCYGDSDRGSACSESYIFSTGRMLILNPYRFGNTILPEEQRVSNNSKILIQPIRTASNPTFRQKVSSFFRSFSR